MDVSSPSSQPQKSRKIWFWAVYAFSLLALLGFAGEAALRLKGLQPWQPLDLPIKVTPGDKLYITHPTLGYANKPGEYTVTLGDGYSYKLTILPDTHRITHPLASYREAGPKKEIWIFGCSFVSGWSLQDQETFPWLLQERFPDYEVVNFGVNGYGTIHSLLQMQEALKTGRVAKMIVYAYAGFHNERNVFLRNWRKIMCSFSKLGQTMQPYARLDAQGRLHCGLARVEYREFPLMRQSALVHFIEQRYDKFEEDYHHSPAVTEALILEMARLAREKGIPLVVAGITDSRGTRQVLHAVREKGVRASDISVDLDTGGYRNLPHDDHPSALADRRYADRLEEIFRAAGL